VDQSNVTYRQELFEATLMMVGQRPWFGTIHVLDHLEHLRQGQGIIDLVNTYAIYAMSYGLVGLGLFVVFLGSGIVFGVEVALRTRKKNAEAYRTAGCTAVALLGSMIVIVAVSNIDSVPLVYTALVAMLVAMVRIERPITDRRARYRSGAPSGTSAEVQVPGGALRS
jgi:O-antigen ligase